MKTFREIISALVAIEEQSIKPLGADELKKKKEKADKERDVQRKKRENIAKQDAQVRKAQLELQKQQVDANLARSKK